MKRTQFSRRRGFTLIELLIVISVIAILALIVVPRLLGAGRKAKESTLRGNLQQLRNAIQSFQSDTGVYPATLDDLVAATGGDVTATINAPDYKGPYLTTTGGIGGGGVPKNPFTDATSETVTDHWNFDADAGTVVVPDGQADLETVDDSIPFSQL
jgi:type II secretion system protein G